MLKVMVERDYSNTEMDIIDYILKRLNEFTIGGPYKFKYEVVVDDTFIDVKFYCGKLLSKYQDKYIALMDIIYLDDLSIVYNVRINKNDKVVLYDDKYDNIPLINAVENILNKLFELIKKDNEN